MKNQYSYSFIQSTEVVDFTDQSMRLPHKEIDHE